MFQGRKLGPDLIDAVQPHCGYKELLILTCSGYRHTEWITYG
jgi:hypothetical protein